MNFINEIPRNNPHLDSFMFMRHNVSQWQEPNDLVFEPSPVWHDDDAIAADETAKVFLRNLLSKSKAQVRELRVEADKKKREVDSTRQIRERIKQDKDSRNEVEVVRSLFFLQEALRDLDRRRLTADVETSTVMTAVGDLSLGAKNHNFKSQTFKMPTNCDLCGDRIWGLSAKGFDCRDCGYTCHSKCEMKVPAECPGETSKEEKKKLKAERQEQANATPTVDLGAPSAGPGVQPSLSRRDTMNSLSSGYTASKTRSLSQTTSNPTQSSSGETAPEPAAETTPKPAAAATAAPAPAKRNKILAPPPSQFVSGSSPVNGSSSPVPNFSSKPKLNEQKGKMLYAYQANGDDEITVREGDDVAIVEPDGKTNLPSSLHRTASHNTELYDRRWIRVDACSCRLVGRTRPSILRRSNTIVIASAVKRHRSYGAPGFNVLEFISVFDGQHIAEASRASRSTPKRSEEASVRRSAV